MQRKVESGKTLLVDGPTSVIVLSGEVEVFGYKITEQRRIVIREGKRLPFTVKKTANFEISLGEDGNLEEVEGSTIPSSWVEAFNKLLGFKSKPITAIVLGGVDCGKSSFCTYLANKLLGEKQRVAILDGDLGQSDIGPPCTLAYTFLKKPAVDLFNLEAENAFFAGFTSPSENIGVVIEGLKTLKDEALRRNPDFLIVNTDGWIEGEDAVNYKVQLVKELNPDVVFCIQREKELDSIFTSLDNSEKFVIESPKTIRQRSSEKRRSLRELGYMKYLKEAKIKAVPISWLKINGNKLIQTYGKHGDSSRLRKIYEILGMKPLHLAEFKDEIYIVLGKRKLLDNNKIRSVEEFAKKKVIIVRKGEEEGNLLALYNDEGKFLGIGVLREMDYRRRVMKIYTAVSEKFSTVKIGKIKLDKNLKEKNTLTEKEFTAVEKLF
ncbi:hypothetical protein J7L49_06700 [Candidatus Bathyarchaeota archaeon]|nr:hypothetical protein [Candidatus Bathyarchaeota archaeon]